MSVKFVCQLNLCQLIPTTVSLSNCDSPLINYKTFVQHLKTHFDKQIIFNGLNKSSLIVKEIVVRESDEKANPSKLGTIIEEHGF